MSTFVRLCRSILLVCTAALVTLSTTAYAQQTLRVPQDYPTIQLAINAAHTGDTVSVASGTWFENLTIDTKEITLISSAGAATTTLDGSHLGPVLKITNTPGIATVVSGFTLQNGSPLGSSQGSVSVGPAGVLIASAAAQITNSTFQKNLGINLGVINGSLVLTASSLSTASTSGGSCSLSPGVGYLNPSTGVSLFGTSTVLTSSGTPAPSVITGNTIFGDGTRCSGVGIQVINLGQALTLQNNTIRNNVLGVDAQAPQLLLLQNLIYDNVNGGLSLNAPSNPPNIEPLTTFVINNTIVNNLTSPDAAFTSPTDIFLNGTVARTAFVNNILVGTTPHPVLTCATAIPSINDTPLVFDHNDLYNTTNAPNSTLTGDCLTAIGGSPNSAPGNLSVDPRLTGSTDLHPLAGSPVIDAGNNSAPGLLFDAFSLASGTVTTQAPLLTDFAGDPRIADATNLGHPLVDMGAYEANGAVLLIPTATVVFTGGFNPQNLLTLSGYTIAASGFRPAGTITFLDNGMPYGPITPGADGVAHGAIGVGGSGVYDFQAMSTLSDPAYAPSTSIVIYTDLADVPTLATTTLTIAASPTAQVLNQPVTLTIHLGSSTTTNGTTTAGPVPPGALALSEGSTILSSLQPDSSGLVTYTIPKPTAGNHIYTVTYAGTTAYRAATASTAVSVTAPAATSLAASISPSPAALGQTVTLAATVTSAAATPTGSITFTDGATALGTVPLAAGAASLSLSTLSAGLHTITIAYTPDPAFAASSTTRSVLVGGDATATTLSSSKNPASTTDTVVYTATVSNTSTAAGTAAPAGSVSLSEGDTLLASAPLVASASGISVAALPVTLSTPGTHILTATYVPATAVSLASTGALTESITAAPPILTTLSATPNPATLGQTITFAATVTSATPLPTPATILFSDGAASLGIIPLASDGTATLAVSTFSIGAHQVTAALRTPDSTVSRSTSPPLLVQVNGLGATLSLAVSPSPTALATAPVTLTATLLPVGPLPANALLTGTVTFFDGTIPLGIVTLSAGGQATLATVILAPGLHTLNASFAGSSIFTPVSSSAISENILLNQTSTQLAAPRQSVAFSPITLAAHITSATTTTSIGTPTCTPACTPITVTFIATTPAGVTTLLGTVPVDATGGASLTINPAAGVYSLVATFNGSALFYGSSSASSTLTVTPAMTALTLSANPNPAYQHSAITLSAALTASAIPTSALAGTITFLEGSTTLGSASLTAAQSFAYAPTTVGAHTLTAVFSGTANLSDSSATATVTVLPSDFVLTVKDPTLTIPTTHHAPTTISINTNGSLADLIDLSCANLPADAHCTFSPATHDLTATNASAGTLTIDTDALLNYAGAHSPASPSGSPGVGFTAVLALTLPPVLLGSILRLRRCGIFTSARVPLPHLLAALLFSVAAFTLTGCSGLYPPHVVPGTYTITITGHARSAGIEHTVPLNLIVTP